MPCSISYNAAAKYGSRSISAMIYDLGIDVGSTTVKVTVLDEALQIVYTSYERHFARVRETVLAQLAVVEEKFIRDQINQILE